MQAIVALRTGRQVVDPQAVARRMVFRHGIEARFIALDNLSLAQRTGAFREAQGWCQILAAIDALLAEPACEAA
jgi:hypothetical protein